MSALLRAEIRKARSTPTIWWLLLATTAVGVVGTLAPLVAADGTARDLLTDQKLQEAMHGAAAGATLVVVAGIIGMAGEWRFGQATQTFLSSPVRRRVVIAKSAVYAGIGLLYGVAAATSATVTAWAWYRANDVTLPLERSAVWLTLVGCVAVAVLFGIVGVAIGAVTRNQVGGIVASLGWLVLLEPALFAAAPTIFRWLPGIASFSLRRQPSEELLGVGPAALVLLGTIAALLVLGTRLVERDDVTT
jgi:ABC-2 type transport system permease protein